MTIFFENVIKIENPIRLCLVHECVFRKKETPFTETLFAFVVTFLLHASKEAFQWLFRKCDIFEELGVLAI